MGFLLAALFLVPFQEASAPPPFCPSLGRELSWDPYGIYPLNADRPLTKASVEIVKDLQEAELGRAELLARYRLKVDKDDLVPAWVLGQILRTRRQGLAEYHRSVEKSIDASGTLPVLLYRLHVCRIAKKEALAAKLGDDLDKRLEREMKALRERCRFATSRHLGLAIGFTQVNVFWALENRKILEEYRSAHPNGVDVRPLLCIAYNTGIGYGLAELEDGRKIKMSHPDEPQPQKVLEIAQSMLKDRPDDALGHFYVGRTQFRLNHLDSAFKEIQIALGTGKLPPVYERAARAFLANPRPAAFLPNIVY